MRFIGNIFWLVFGGIFIAIEYFAASFVLIITIIGIPFGLQTLKLGILALWPFGKEVTFKKGSPGCLSTIMNIIWLIFGGIWICLSHVLLAILLAITIIGISFARQHLKLASLALTPFGREIVDK